MIHIKDLTKSYRMGLNRVAVLNNIELHIEKGEFVAIMGSSGSGKTTLMNIIGCLDKADRGQYVLGRINVGMVSEEQLAGIRNRMLGFVFQSFSLIPRISAHRNVELPMVYAGVAESIRRNRALAALDIVGIRDRAFHTPGEMSGGQQQRVAIARSIVNNPDVIIADEPTGALDSHNSLEIMRIFTRLNQGGKTIVMVTHENDIASHAHRIINVRDGSVV